MILRLSSTSSTMKDAAELAARGEPHGSAVTAEEQTAGIGRQGHTWHSERGAGLYLSIVLRIDEPRPILTLALGLAVQRAVNDLTGCAADLRWPNDLLVNERKAAGVLVQAEGSALIAGIGVNVNQTQFPEELRDIATSLRIETGREQPKDALLDRILAESLRYAAMDPAEVLRRFEANSSYARGRRVIVEEKQTGITEGLDPDGFLRLRTPEGLTTIVAGGVRPV